jgi:hypothetical protein
MFFHNLSPGLPPTSALDHQPDSINSIMSKLSGSDAAVLGALFDPEASLSNTTEVDDRLPQGLDRATHDIIQSEETSTVLPLNKEDPSPGDINTSIASLSHLITQFPSYASLWNNRGQARRMLFNLGSIREQSGLLRDIVGDLDQAIALSSPLSPAQPVPELDARVLASAHTHRGLLLWAASRSEELRASLEEAVTRFAGLDSERLEELASVDFAAGGRYGNDTAKQLAVKLNPYAKLCGSIVKEAMQKEISDFYQIPVTKVV